VVATLMNCSSSDERLPQGRRLMMRQIEEDGWTVAAAALSGLSGHRYYEQSWPPGCTPLQTQRATAPGDGVRTRKAPVDH